jgi:hypothetical protein
VGQALERACNEAVRVSEAAAVQALAALAHPTWPPAAVGAAAAIAAESAGGACVRKLVSQVGNHVAAPDQGVTLI